MDWSTIIIAALLVAQVIVGIIYVIYRLLKKKDK